MFCNHAAVEVIAQTLCAGTMVAALGGGLVLHGRSRGDAGHQHQLPHPGEGNAAALGCTQVSHPSACASAAVLEP